MPGFYMDSGDPDSGPHTCKAVASLLSSFANPSACCSYLLLVRHRKHHPTYRNMTFQKRAKQEDCLFPLCSLRQVRKSRKACLHLLSSFSLQTLTRAVLPYSTGKQCCWGMEKNLEKQVFVHRCEIKPFFPPVCFCETVHGGTVSPHLELSLLMVSVSCKMWILNDFILSWCCGSIIHKSWGKQREKPIPMASFEKHYSICSVISSAKLKENHISYANKGYEFGCNYSL